MKKVLVFGGKTGWIGGLMCEMLAKEGTVMLVVVKQLGLSFFAEFYRVDEENNTQPIRTFLTHAFVFYFGFVSIS